MRQPDSAIARHGARGAKLADWMVHQDDQRLLSAKEGAELLSRVIGNVGEMAGAASQTIENWIANHPESLTEADFRVNTALHSLKRYARRLKVSAMDRRLAQEWQRCEGDLSEAKKALLPLLARRGRPAVRLRVRSLRRAEIKLRAWHERHRPSDAALADAERWAQFSPRLPPIEDRAESPSGDIRPTSSLSHPS